MTLYIKAWLKCIVVEIYKIHRIMGRDERDGDELQIALTCDRHGVARRPTTPPNRSRPKSAPLFLERL